ncbi:MAG TPA: ribulose-phosphate 3-epimerase [Planctomycetaceae bacterium]|nr:ribulose-phosphate 3-epimerase [Planctomycetaceae bacterium]
MTGPAVLSRLLNGGPFIAPSMLKCDFANLHREAELLESAGARLLHMDVMDGHFVPNLTYGAVVIQSLRGATSLPFEAHLMISDPAKYVDEFLGAGCNLITFHIEAVSEPVSLLRRIRDRGAAAGLAFNPKTPVEAVLPFLPECDHVLVMSVEPGFGGQKFMPSVLDKVRRLASEMGENRLLSIDGGIGPKTIPEAARAGAREFVVGSAIFETPDYRDAIEKMTHAAAGAAVSANSE